MPEVSKHAAILIATSWQALNRAIERVPNRILCDCTVVILFASFYVEANLNDIIEKLHKTPQMKSFFNPQRFPGPQDKLAWFYNEHVAKKRALTKRKLYAKGIKRKIRRRFPGFAELYRFRNDISHGVINRSADSLKETRRLRKQAKDMVNELFKIAEKSAGRPIPRVTNYYDAIRR